MVDINNYKNLLKGLYLYLGNFDNDIDSTPDKKILKMIKHIIHMIEFHTNLDLYNQFSDLYE